MKSFWFTTGLVLVVFTVKPNPHGWAEHISNIIQMACAMGCFELSGLLKKDKP